jgi:hypothetical protein
VTEEATVEVASVGCTVVGMAAVATAVVEAIAAVVDCTECAELAVVAAEAGIVGEQAPPPMVAVDTVAYMSHFLCRNIKQASIMFIFSRT